MQQRTGRWMLACALAGAIAAAATPSLAQGGGIDPADFVAVIDNPYWPLIPGTTFVYESESDDEVGRVEIAVTHATREILGVTCTVVFDRAFENGLLVERTYDWYAQDVDGNIWYFGEYSEEIDPNGAVIGTEGSWEAGVDGAEPGIIMPAHPQAGDSYYQEYYEGEAEDEAKILRTHVDMSTNFGEFEDCLKTKEYTKLSPGDVEHKFYCPGIGLVRVEELKEKTTIEELVDVIAGP